MKLHTSLTAGESGAIGTVGITGIPTAKWTSYLWDKWRIIVTPIVHADNEGARVTPNVYTTLEEVDTFAGALLEVADKGLPT